MKATKARSWYIPVVNHTWLQDCFVQWENLMPELEEYIVFPDGMDSPCPLEPFHNPFEESTTTSSTHVVLLVWDVPCP